MQTRPGVRGPARCASFRGTWCYKCSSLSRPSLLTCKGVVPYRTVPYLFAGASALGRLDSSSSRGSEALDWRWNDTMSMYLSRAAQFLRLRLSFWPGGMAQQTASGHQLEQTGAVVVKLHLASYCTSWRWPSLTTVTATGAVPLRSTLFAGRTPGCRGGSPKL